MKKEKVLKLIRATVDKTRTGITEPFVMNGYLAATNGIIVYLTKEEVDIKADENYKSNLQEKLEIMDIEKFIPIIEEKNTNIKSVIKFLNRKFLRTESVDSFFYSRQIIDSLQCFENNEVIKIGFVDLSKFTGTDLKLIAISDRDKRNIIAITSSLHNENDYGVLLDSKEQNVKMYEKLFI